MESFSLMLSGRTFQREGATYLKAQSLAVPLCLGISGPGNIKERSRCWSEEARRVVFLEKIREVEGGVIMNWPVSGRENFVADPFVDGKQWSCLRMGVMWSVFLHFMTVLAAAFCTACRRLICFCGKRTRICFNTDTQCVRAEGLQD